MRASATREEINVFNMLDPKQVGPGGGGGHSIVKNTGGWLDSLGSGILVGKDILGFYKNIDLHNS